MPDIFDEVEEELRAERTRQFLTRYAGALVAVAVLIIALVAGWQGWRWYQERQDQAAADLYIQSMLQIGETGPKTDAARAGALSGFGKLAQSGPAGYRTVARLRAAALEAATGHQSQALGLWNEVAADSSADPLLRDLANLLWAQHQIDTGDPALLETRLRPLAEPINPWHAMAEEELAWLALRQGKTAQAKDMLTALTRDANTPDGVRERATAILTQLRG
ncbi:MAG TPA: tetratricopeptide repeat protein [Acetobacteraceae bacterium]